MNLEESIAQALGFKELELIKANEAIRVLTEELTQLKELQETPSGVPRESK